MKVKGQKRKSRKEGGKGSEKHGEKEGGEKGKMAARKKTKIQIKENEGGKEKR